MQIAQTKVIAVGKMEVYGNCLIIKEAETQYGTYFMSRSCASLFCGIEPILCWHNIVQYILKNDH